MIHEVYTIYDRKEKRYTSPFTSPSREITVQMVKEQSDQIPRPEDMVLCPLGYFDDTRGRFVIPKKLVYPSIGIKEVLNA